EVPAAFRESCREGGSVRETLDRLAVYARSSATAAAVAEQLAALQARLDREAGEVQEATASLRRHGGEAGLHPPAALVLQHQLERFEDLAGEFGLGTRLSGTALAAVPG